MTISFECHMVKGKLLLIKFTFNSFHETSNHRLICNSLDKYMSVDVWTKLYEKLGKPIEQYVKNEKKRPKDEIIEMHRAQLDLHLSWKKIDAVHSTLCGEPMDKLYLYSLVVDVCTVSRVNDFMKKFSKSKSLVNGTNGDSQSVENDISPQSTTTAGSGGNAGNDETIKVSRSKRRYEEYVPEATTVPPKHSHLSYTPRKIADSGADEYTPTKMVVVDASAIKTELLDDDHHYYPSPIGNNNNQYDYSDSQPYSRGPIKSPRPNKIRATTSKMDLPESSTHQRSSADEAKSSNNANSSQDLFVDSQESEDEAKQPLPSAMSTRSSRSKTKPAIQRTLSSYVIPKTSSSTSSSTFGAKASTSNAKVSSSDTSIHQAKKSKKKPTFVEKPTEIAGPVLSKADKELLMVNELILKKIKDNTLIDSSGKQIGLTRIIDLKDLSIEELKGTFDEHATPLTEIFEARRWETRPRPSPDYDPNQLNQTLLTDKQQCGMVDRLTEKLSDPNIHGITPFHHLFWDVMISEWALLVFGKRYDLTREEALDQMRKYDRAYFMYSPDDFNLI